MLKSKLKKLLCGVLAASATVACAGTLSACETSRPEMQMQLSFNGQTYTLNYELYRKLAPATVSHFMKLVENDYYDGMCIHNYTSSKMYTGVYSYEEESTADNGLVYKDYFTFAQTFGVATRVFEDEALTKPTYTLYGEFSSNGGFTISNGDFLKQSFGALTMYYTSKGGKEAYQAYVKQHSGSVAERPYEYNSATSEFFITLSTSSTSSSLYCTFATLKSGSADVLTDLKDAIAAYIDGKEDEDYSFTESVDMIVDEDDPIIGGEQTVSYELPKEPIVVEYITITKY